jgi:guanylate kinase
MIHCIVGHSARGKTTVQNHLKDYLPSITTYTTRPIRKNEKNGIHYHFINNNEFLEKIEGKFFVEYYYIPENQWYYGVSLKNIDYKNKDYTLVLDPKGYVKLLQTVGKEYLQCYYIRLSEHERLVRMAQRKDGIEEIFRRIFSDRKDFEHFEYMSDVVLGSTDSITNCKLILERIKEKAM